ncbi:PEP-CTERM sorting domain-containing protein [Thalassomonas sp. RHCl1]|uniref:PEP-CTERM sorting domain-containing protein n=1 Tax=Thalassomonas sp. RHCl1 TaxID=2995320 RepID=UPI00248AD26C|nr:PEP-CTERM sorting domain-containing protein [Thalassomonas sp. RHCl1]
MKLKFLKLPLAGLILCVSGLFNVANAGLITIGALTSNDDGSTNVITDTLNDREWLRWDLLADLTHAQTLAEIASGAYAGWTIAGADDANLFLDALYGGADHGCSDNVTIILNCADTGSYTSPQYKALFGDSGSSGTETAWFYDDTLTDNQAGMLYLHNGEDNRKINTYSTIAVSDNFSKYGLWSSSGTIGWLMYRSTAQVPEPPALAIFALALAGFGLRRFTKQ